MPSRAQLEAMAVASGVDASLYPNDSKLEQRVIYAQRTATQTPGTKATQTLTSTGVAPANNDTVTIGSVTYTYKTALTGAANEVLIGASADAALDNLKSAINETAGSGTTYGTGTDAHPQVTATTNTATTQVVQAIEPGTASNSIATTETSTVLSWGAATLTGGTASAGSTSSYQLSGGTAS